jgi:signal transduction histidine kinase
MNKGGLGLGTLYLEFDQLRIQSGNAYPRLLLDEQYAEKLKTDPFDYGVFKEGELVRSSGSFNYQQEEMELLLQNPSLLEKGVEALGYQHLGIKNGEELWVLSSPVISVKQFFGTFSLFFVVFVFLTFLSILGSVLLQGYRKFEFNYSTKLQLYLNFAFFFPILIISQSYKEDLNGQYLQKATLIKGNLVRFFAGQNIEEVDRDALSEEINALATTVGTDIHLYGKEGSLITSSRITIFEKKLLSNRMHPGAMAGLVEGKGVEELLEEQVGKLRYQTVYLAIPSQTNSSINAVVAIPFFESEEELNSLISDVLGNVFNAFVVIFILFLIISFLVTKNLTLPFRLLTQKLKVTNLENNEPMYWSSKDEIGLLVNEYNLMLSKLEASKKVLASTEKESAWREMAKQVAHEIKNPLTPMKLTLQHLLRLEKEGKLEDADKLKKSLETLIHQVDALSGIASSFSTFAKMPLPNNELMNFKEVLLRVLELFKTDKRMELEFQDDSFTDQITILGDDKLFGRVISNLIINGMQAVEPGKKSHIRIWLWLTDRAVFLEISDNGKGIPVELRDKIFIPNFSTKSQGSGLGLAIAKSGVETAGGQIWFETEVGKGTTFFLTFPLAKVNS